MKIVIVGAGAMGCLFASRLSKSREEIWILEKKKERALKINQQGIVVEEDSGSWNAKVKVTAEAKEIGKADLAIICVKAYDTKEAVSASKPVIGEDTKVVTLQNGIGNIEIIGEKLAEGQDIEGYLKKSPLIMLGPPLRPLTMPSSASAFRGVAVVSIIDSSMVRLAITAMPPSTCRR